MSNLLSYTVPLTATGQRLDTWLSEQPEIGSRTQAARLIDQNRVKVSGIALLKVKASYRLRGEEVISVEIPAPVASHIKPQDIPLEILYQDYDIAVVLKPAGMVAHPAAGNFEGTLINSLLFHIKDLSDIGGVERPGLVHRLDKDTSGILVVAKNNKSHKTLSDLFKNHEIDRVYWALVAGVPRESKKTIISNLARHPVHRKAFSSQEKGKKAITHYEVQETFSNQISLLKVTLETGRTHQIRVHLSELGHPIVGDKLYGLKKQSKLINKPEYKSWLKLLPRQALHASTLGFEHPRTKEKLSFSADWPLDLKQIIQTLRQKKNFIS